MVQTVFAQEHSTWTTIDTLAELSDRILVEYKTYTDSSLNEHAQAFLIPIVQKRPKYRVLGSLFKTEIQFDSIVFHGDRISYLDNQYYKTETFEQGQLISTKYFNSDEQEILKTEFDSFNNTVGPCGIITGHYFFNGTKMKKRKTGHNKTYSQ